MSAAAPEPAARLVLFELGRAAYALPIEDVVEVSEPLPPAGIPLLPRRVASVVNLHGEPLPVISRHAVLEVGEPAGSAPAHVLVIGDGPETRGVLGLPVDRVIGIVRAERPGGARGELVAERREIDGRIVTLLDARQLVARARAAIEREAGAGAEGGSA